MGLTSCKMVTGELIYIDEVYLGTTETEHHCVQEVRKRADEANGMLWTTNTHDCWAKYGSSNSTINPNGCNYCKSCFFGKPHWDSNILRTLLLLTFSL